VKHESELFELHAKLDSLRLQIANLISSKEKVRERIGSSRANDLDKLTDAEAIQYLKSVDDSALMDGYLYLSERLDPTVLVEICTQYMARPARNARLTGIARIGTLLKGTSDNEVSRTLARIVRDTNEADDIRLVAHTSLVLINKDRLLDKDEFGSPAMEAEDSALPWVDWHFVDSFLK
jgi:hypothetical protein